MSTVNNMKDSSHLPLFGLTVPLDSISEKDLESDYGERELKRMRNPNALSDWSVSPLMIRERQMIQVMGQLTDKPEWKRKILDEEIVRKWKKECIELWQDEPVEEQFSEKMFDYCIGEMQDYAKFEEEHGYLPAIRAEAVVLKSDTIIPTELKEELRAAVLPLEQVPESQKDWHPDSDEKVLDLVHPSLFPLLYGRSRVLKPAYGDVLSEDGSAWEGCEGKVLLDDCEQWVGKGGVMPVPKKDHYYSSRFQWLPCEVAFHGDDSVKITSYINNLQPRKHKDLYHVLERVIANVIPMWNDTLGWNGRYDRKIPRIDLDDEIPWKNPEGQRTPDENEDEDDTSELDREWIEENRTLVPPEPRLYEPGSLIQNDEDSDYMKPPKTDLRKDFSEHGLQVIVKLANIHLSPEKPDYEGGTWHIEGQLNEYICASALYYYDNSNITDSHLSFREAINVEIAEEYPYEQSDLEHLELLFGIVNHEAAMQELGAVLTREDRVLTFPNVLQHRVGPFSLADKTKPGHRKILALFLVDPYTRIPSTAIVPPQQKDWWKDMVHGLDRVSKLPLELRDWVTDTAGDFPIELDEAKKLRVELMNERRFLVDNDTYRPGRLTYSFCEH